MTTIFQTIKDIAHYLPEYYLVDDPIDYAFAGDMTTLMVWTEIMGDDEEVTVGYNESLQIDTKIKESLNKTF